MKKIFAISLMALVTTSAFASPKDAVKRVGYGVKVVVTAPYKGVKKLFSKPAVNVQKKK